MKLFFYKHFSVFSIFEGKDNRSNLKTGTTGTAFFILFFIKGTRKQSINYSTVGFYIKSVLTAMLLMFMLLIKENM